MNKIFITGTGTDIGKSIVCAGILRELRKRGHDAVPMKPVQSGAEINSTGKLFSPDIDVALMASGYTIPEEEKDHTCPYMYKQACSPHLAAELSGLPYPDMETVNNSMNFLSKLHEILVIEGAGGIQVPLDRKNTTIDLIKKLEVPVLLVISNELGCINHALNTIAVLRSNGIEIAGGVMTHTTPETAENSFIRKNNPETIENMSSVKIISEIKHMENFDPKSEASWQKSDEYFAEICNKLFGEL